MPDQLFWSLKEELVDRNTIDESLYKEWDVKRGLRHADGSGVLAGLTKISSVIGAKKENGEMIPVEGKLSYRGIPIEDLSVEPSTRSVRFEHAIFLLLMGRKPNPDELERFKKLLITRRQVSPHLIEHLIKAVPSVNVMNKLQTVVSGLYTEDPHAESMDPFENLVKAINLIAKMPTLISYAYLSAYRQNATYMTPPADMTIAEAFLYMLREGQPVTDVEKETLDLCLLLHAEHGGGNNSTFTTKVVSSTETDIYGAICAALGSLKGPLHGAANKKVMDMMADIMANVSNWSDTKELGAYLKKLIQKKAHDRSGKIYGLGHAVYTKSDPRALILKEKAHDLALEKGRLDEYHLYLAIAEHGPVIFQKEKGSDKLIAPNVDFFSGFVYDCLGIPKEVYTAMFAMARVVGWCAHRIEESLSGKRVIRPAYKYVG